MKRTQSIFALVMVWAFVSFAQMTERVTDTSVYRLGNRPVKGTKILTFGLSLNSDSSLFSSYNLLNKGSVLTGKYFISDKVAIRAGLRLSKESSSSGGEIDTALSGGTTLKNEFKSLTRNFAIVPGIEYHFSNSNFFDVYTGGDLYLGLQRDFTKENYDYVSDLYDYTTSRKRTTNVGLGGVVGVNMFILDLPISLGVEYGLSGIWQFGNKTKVVHEYDNGTGAKTDEYFTQSEDALGSSDANDYSKIKKSSTTIETNNNLRVILNIYFK